MPLTEALRAGTEQAQLALWICSAWPAGTDAASIDADPNCGIMRTCTTTLSVVAYQKTSPDLFVCATGAREETGA